MDRRNYLHFCDNLPAYIRTINSSSNAIYLICLCIVLGILVSLPLVSIPVSVSGHGMIRPDKERAELVLPVSGVVEEVYVQEGMHIEESSPVLRIRSNESAASLEKEQEELLEIRLFLEDVERLLARPINMPRSNRFIKEYETYTSRLNYLDMLYQKSHKECERLSGLFEKELISAKEYDDLCFERARIRQDIEYFKRESLNKWQAAHHHYRKRERELESMINKRQEQIRLTTVRAPVGGSLVNFRGIYPGTTVHAGEVVGIISPDSRLIGEFYIKPADIAFIFKGQSVRLHMLAFPPREWGMADARISDISDDYLLMDQQLVYRVKCELLDSTLCLNSGFRGQLKKGMTFQAHCLVVRRTLLQLLWDKTDDWLNPLTHAPN